MESRAKDIVPIIQFLKENVDFYLAPTMLNQDALERFYGEQFKAQSIFNEILSVLTHKKQSEDYINALIDLKEGKEDRIKQILNPLRSILLPSESDKEADTRAIKLMTIFEKHIKEYNDNNDHPIRRWRQAHPKRPTTHDDPFAEVTLHEIGQKALPKKPAKEKEDTFAESRKHLDESMAAFAPSTAKTPTPDLPKADPKIVINKLKQVDAALEEAYLIRLQAHQKNVEKKLIGDKSADVVLVDYINALNQAKKMLYQGSATQALPAKPTLKELQTAIDSTRSSYTTRNDLQLDYYIERLTQIRKRLAYLHNQQSKMNPEMWLALHEYANQSFNKLKEKVDDLLNIKANDLDNIIKSRQKTLEDAKSAIESVLKQLAEDAKTVAESATKPKPEGAEKMKSRLLLPLYVKYKTPKVTGGENPTVSEQADDILAKMRGQTKPAGITYSANRGQTLALLAYYQNTDNTKEEDLWKKVIAVVVGSGQAPVMAAFLAKLTPEERKKFRILPISTIGPDGKKAQDIDLQEELQNIHKFLKEGGQAFGWQNEDYNDSKEKKYAVGGKTAGTKFSQEQSDYVQDYLNKLHDTPDTSLVPEVTSIDDFKKAAKVKPTRSAAAAASSAPTPATSPSPTPAASPAPASAAASSAPRSPALNPPASAPAPTSPQLAPAASAPAAAPGGPAPAAKPVPAAQPDFTKQAVRDKHRPTIENVKKRFDEYRKLINHYRSVANVAIASMDQQKFLEIQAKCKELEEQLRLYQGYTKYKFDQAETAEKSPGVLDKIRYDSSELIKQRLDNIDALLVKLDAVIKMAPTPQRVHAFSHQSEVIDINDIEKKKSEYLGTAAGTNPASKGLLKKAIQETTAEFSTKARVNKLQYGEAVFVSVQQVEKGVYQSSFYSNDKLDLSMQGKLLGHRIPNDSLLAIAIKEVQNWRAGNPDSESTMVIEGAMPKALVEAIVLYCEHRGYKYSNDTVHQIKLSSIQMSDYRERLRQHPGHFIDNIDNRGLLDKGQDVAAAQRHTEPPKP